MLTTLKTKNKNKKKAGFSASSGWVRGEK